VTSIGDSAFYTSKIETIDIPISVAAFDAGNVFYDTPCCQNSKCVFKTGTAVENCEIVRVSIAPTTSATAPPTTSSTTLIVAVGLGFAVLALLALVVLLLRKNKSGEDEGVNATENEMTEGHELTEIQREEIEGLEVSV